MGSDNSKPVKKVYKKEESSPEPSSGEESEEILDEPGELQEQFEQTLEEATQAFRQNSSSTSPSLEDCHVYYLLSDLYRRGLGVPPNNIKSELWCRRALEQGGLAKISHAAESKDAVSQYILGQVYFFGHARVIPNYKEAFRLTQLSAEMGYSPAETFLGYMFEKGYGVRKNLSKAFSWYEEAAAFLKEGFTSDVRGKYSLGCMLYEGEGTEKNIVKGLEWMGLAAERGWAMAQRQTAILCVREDISFHQKGPNFVREYLEKATEQGDAIAAEYLRLSKSHDLRKLIKFLPEHPSGAAIYSKLDKLEAWEAARHDWVGLLEYLLDPDRQGRAVYARIDAADEEGEMLLHVAAICKSLEVARFLLRKNADLNVTNDKNETPLIAAVKYLTYLYNPLEMVKLLYQKTNLDLHDNENKTAIAWSVINQLPDVLELLLDVSINKEAEINKKYKNENGCTLFLLAAKGGCERIIDILAERNSDILAVSNQGEDALMMSAYDSTNLLGKKFIKMGVSVIGKNSKGKTALQIAIQYDHLQMIIALVAARTLFLIANRQLACPKDKVLDALFKHIGSMSLRDNHFRTLLHVAASSNNEILSDYLLANEAGALVNAKDEEGQNPEEIAEGPGYEAYEYDFSDIVEHQKLLVDKSPILASLLNLYTPLIVKGNKQQEKNATKKTNKAARDTKKSTSSAVLPKPKITTSKGSQRKKNVTSGKAQRHLRNDAAKRKILQKISKRTRGIQANTPSDVSTTTSIGPIRSLRNKNEGKVEEISEQLSNNSTKEQKPSKVTESVKASISSGIFSTEPRRSARIQNKSKVEEIPEQLFSNNTKGQKPSNVTESVKASISSGIFSTPRRSPQNKGENLVKANESLSSHNAKRKRAEEPDTSQKWRKLN